MNYADILASIVHDVKNSLSMVSHYADQMMQDAALSGDTRDHVSVMQQEVRRANNQLVQILSLYKLEKHRLVPNIIENNVYDFLEELLIEERVLAKMQHIQMSIQCDEWLSAYFDQSLIRSVLSSTIGNAKRYSNKKVLLTAEMLDGYLVFRIEDDGNGFPENFIQCFQSDDNQCLDKSLSEGSTQLGLFFASNIAKIHQNRGVQGFVRLQNGRSLAGGCFELWIP